MFGDNPSGAGNQQERPGIEQWVVGFVEASPLIKSQANGISRFLESSEAIRQPTLIDVRVEEMVLPPRRRGDAEERNSLSGKFRPARMA
jgi:hypothetical protein